MSAAFGPAGKGLLEFDWSRLSKGAAHREFENMCIDLIAAEYGDVDLVQGPRRSGRDGGSDAIYFGRIGRHRGSWKVACAVRQNPSALKTKIDEERSAAVRHRFTALAVMTSLDLDAPTASTLSTRASKRLKAGLVWGRSALERLLRKHPWVAAIYFGHQILPGFVPLGRGDENDLADQPDLDFIGRKGDLERIHSFLEGTDRVLVVLAPGGAGKSRLLRELSSVARRASGRRSSWLRRPGVGTIEDALRGGLPIRRPVLLALDDAGRVADEVRQFAMLASSKAQAIDVKVVIAARSVDREAIESELRDASAGYDVLELSEPPVDDMAEIAHLEFAGLDADVSKSLATKFGPNLFLLRAAVRFVRDGIAPSRIVRRGELRSLVGERFVKEAVGHLSALCDDGATRQLLLATALDVPLLASRASLPQEALLEAGLLRIVGDTLRFRADVEGDVVLGYLLEKPWAGAWLERNLRTPPEMLFLRVRNLAASGDNRPCDAIRKICREWLASAGTTDRWQRRKILEVLQHCVDAAPEEVASLCATYTSTLGTHSTDDFGPCVLALARSGSSRIALRLARELGESGLKSGTYSNYKTPNLANEIASIRYLSDKHVLELVEEVALWLEGPLSLPAADVIGGVLSSLLSPVFRWDSSDGATLTLHEQAVPSSPRILTYRREAITLVGKMLSHSETHVRLGGAKLLAEHARGRGGLASNKRLDAARGAEFQLLVPLLDARLSAEQDLEVLNCLEEGLVFRWAGQEPGTKAAERLLRVTPWPLLLVAYRFSTKPWEFYLDVVQIMDRAPDIERWSWWVNHTFHTRTGAPEPADAARLVAMLATSFPTATKLVEAVAALRGADRLHNLLDSWCRHPGAIDAFRDAAVSATSPEVRAIFEKTLRRFELSDPTFDHAGEVRSLFEKGAQLPEVESLLRDMPRLSVESILEVARILVDRPTVEERECGLNLIRYRADIERGLGLELLQHALRDGTWLGGWGAIWGMVHDADGKRELASRPALRDLIVERLVDGLTCTGWDLHGNEEYHVDEVVRIVLGSDDERRLRVVERVVADGSSWHPSLGRIAAPLLATPKTLGAFAQVLADCLARGIPVDACRRVLVSAIGDGALLPHAMPLALSLLGERSESARLCGLILLSEMRDSPLACVELAELAVASGGVAELAGRLIGNFTLPRGVYSSAMAQAPPAFLALQRVLASATAAARTKPAAARLSALHVEVGAMIAQHIRGGEEELDPR